MNVHEIPLTPAPQTIQTALNGTIYGLRLYYADAPEAGWCMDIADANGEALVCGIPLVTGCDLLEQYEFLSIGGGGHLYVGTPGNPPAVPTYANLGIDSHLYFETV